MVSSSKIRTKGDHRIKVGSTTRLLKHAVIYGANASGKSNLIDFFRFFKATLEDGIPVWGTKYFCRNQKENESRSSIFEREERSKPQLDSSFTLSKEEKNRFETYASDFEDNIADLFLTEMNRGKKFLENSNLQVFHIIFDWLKKNIV